MNCINTMNTIKKAGLALVLGLAMVNGAVKAQQNVAPVAGVKATAEAAKALLLKIQHVEFAKVCEIKQEKYEFSQAAKTLFAKAKEFGRTQLGAAVTVVLLAKTVAYFMKSFVKVYLEGAATSDVSGDSKDGVKTKLSNHIIAEMKKISCCVQFEEVQAKINLDLGEYGYHKFTWKSLGLESLMETIAEKLVESVKLINNFKQPLKGKDPWWIFHFFCVEQHTYTLKGNQVTGTIREFIKGVEDIIAEDIKTALIEIAKNAASVIDTWAKYAKETGANDPKQFGFGPAVGAALDKIATVAADKQGPVLDIGWAN